MGEEIDRSHFDADDFKRFSSRLREETDLLSQLVANNQMSKSGFVAGFEIEAWLLDHNFFPNPINETFLETLSHPFAVPELSRFNVELNCDPLELTGSVLRQSNDALTSLWNQCNTVAHSLDANMVMVGTLPIIRDSDLTLATISPVKRFEALNNEMLRQRGGRPVTVDIQGQDHVRSEHADLMLESAATSFQVHLKPPAHLAHRYYNASLMTAGPILAAGVNAPFLFRKALWDETRIPLFEQAIPLTTHDGAQKRVDFGPGYLKESIFEAFAENLSAYPVLLPIHFDEPPGKLHHLRLHNGTIWRWVRPLIGFEEDGIPHFRIEYRILPAGPTIMDMIANAALYFGLVRYMVDTDFDLRAELSFTDAKRNFYAAAQHGLSAALAWPGRKPTDAPSLLLDVLLPAADEGLSAFGVTEADRELFLDIVAARARSGQTGAAWQRASLARHGGDFHKMLSAYCEGQRSAIPVHQWAI